MKRNLLFFLFFLLIGFTLKAQLQDCSIAPNFTATDIDGNTHNLYDYLDEGKIVILQVEATWNTPGWNYLQTGVLNDIWETQGQNGTGEVVVLMIEGDISTTEDNLNGIGSNTQGDWTEECLFPIIDGTDGLDIATDYAINYYPTVFIIYPNRTLKEAGQIGSEGFADLFDTAPVGQVGTNNVAILETCTSTTFACGEVIPSFQVMNLGTANLTSFEVDLENNGNSLQSFTWTGDLEPYGMEELFIDPVIGFGEMEMTLSVSLPNASIDEDNSNNIQSNFFYAPSYNFGEEFILNLTPDAYPEEISVQIIDPNGQVLYLYQGTESFEAGVLFQLDFNELTFNEPGCYQLVIEDSYGDGLLIGNNDSSIEIINNGTVIYDDPNYEFAIFIPFYNQFEYDFGATAAAFLDDNGNGVFDAGEQPLLNQDFSIDPTGAFSFNNNGNTTFILDPNTDYTLTWEESALWNLNGDASVSFSVGTDDFDETFYFALTPVGDFVIQDIDLTSAITRCNQSTNYWLSYSNTGTSTNNGYVQLIPDELTTFVNANPAPDSTAGDTLYWFYEDLLPSYSNQILVQFEMPSVDFINQSIDFEANVETWDGSGNKKTNLSSELVCAYDPNDKLVFPNGYGEEKNYTLFEDSLEYTVRFQNTGNDTAFTVLISDEIDLNLNINTLRILSSSHELETTINAETREVDFLFNDIYLPDSFVNEPASHGFVKYEILPNQGLNEETAINNTAHIFFDQNPPIVTNTITNTMVSELPSLPVIASSPIEVDFGEVFIGETQNENVSILNPGDLDLIVTEIISESAIFSPQTDLFTVPGNGEVIINVSFTPIAETVYQSNLVLSSNAGELIIPIKGQGATDTGINELDWRLSVTPNPSNGLFELTWEDENWLQEAVLKVFDASGKTILIQEINGSNSQIDLTAQAKGIYFLSLENKEGTITKKLIVN